MALIPPEAEELLDSPVVTVTRHADIYESDGEALLVEGVPILAGQVSVDASSEDSRRTLDMTLLNLDGKLDRQPSGLWYDKVIKVHRGIEGLDRSGVHRSYSWQVGEFLVDRISRSHFPRSQYEVTGRDFAKRLVLAKFGIPTTFAAGTDVIFIIEAIARNGGIVKFDFSADLLRPASTQDYVFEPDTSRWDAIREIASSINLDVFFTATGHLTLRLHADPATMEPAYRFKTGVEGNLTSYTVATSDSRLYNDVVVTGEGVDPPVVGRATNANLDSPSNIYRLGVRTYRYNSGFIHTEEQAREVAQSFLAVHSLEEYEVSLEGVAAPFLDVGSVIAFDDPDPDAGQSVNFFLTNLTIPLEPGPMSTSAKRVLIV